jgi:hypothetical protein
MVRGVACGSARAAEDDGGLFLDTGAAATTAAPAAALTRHGTYPGSCGTAAGREAAEFPAAGREAAEFPAARSPSSATEVRWL